MEQNRVESGAVVSILVNMREPTERANLIEGATVNIMYHWNYPRRLC